MTPVNDMGADTIDPATIADARTTKRLKDDSEIYPGHGAGSLCGKAIGARDSSTVGYEKNITLHLFRNRRRSGFKI